MKQKIMAILMAYTQKYNHKKYWKMRSAITQNFGGRFIRLWYLYKIKKMDAFNGASFGTHLDKSALLYFFVSI